MNKKGFTLSELMIVLIIISGLMFLIIPNISDSKKSLEEGTCAAYVDLVNSQIQAYNIKHKAYPNELKILEDEKYIKSTKCPDGTEIMYDLNTNIAYITTTTTESTSDTEENT